MIRTTIRLDQHLMHDLKKLAAETHRTLTSLIEDALRDLLARKHHKRPRSHIHLPTFKADGLLPGIDLNNSALLWDLTERK